MLQDYVCAQFPYYLPKCVCLVCPCHRAQQTIIIVIVIIITVRYGCLLHRAFSPRTSLETTVIPIAQASSFRLQYFPYYV